MTAETETPAFQRTWTQVGAKHYDTPLEGGGTLTREGVEAAIDGLDWIDVEQTVPMMPGLGIRATIEQLDIPKVSHVAYQSRAVDDGDLPFPLAPHGFYGVEGHYKNGRARVYVLDLGTELTPLASDFWPAV